MNNLLISQKKISETLLKGLLLSSGVRFLMFCLMLFCIVIIFVFQIIYFTYLLIISYIYTMCLDHILPLLSFFSSLQCFLLHLSPNFMASFVVISNPLSQTRAFYMNMSVASCTGLAVTSSEESACLSPLQPSSCIVPPGLGPPPILCLNLMCVAPCHVQKSVFHSSPPHLLAFTRLSALFSVMLSEP